MAAKLTRGDGGLELTLKGHPDFATALAAAKAVPGRRFDGDRKLWIFPAEPEIAERLMVTVKPEVDADILGWVRAAKAEKQGELLTPLPDDAELFVPWRDALFPFQRALVDFAVTAATEAGQTRLILADDMGLGKTAQGLSVVAEAYIRHGLDNGPRLVVAPNSVKGGWEREIKRWVGPDEPYIIADGSTFKRRRKQIVEGIANDAWVIVNWEQIRVKVETLRLKGKDKDVLVMREPLMQMPHLYDVIDDMSATDIVREQGKLTALRGAGKLSKQWLAALADEAHRAKNMKASQSKGLHRIHATIQMALTGTPVMNSPDELFSLLKWLWPNEYTSYWRFFDDYVDHYEGQYGKIITGVKNPDRLRFELSKRLKRRTKKQVLKDLPEKTRTFLPVTLGKKQRELYEKAEKDMWFEIEQAIKEGDKTAQRFAKRVAENPAAVFTIENGAARTTRLRQIASTPANLGGEDDSAKLDAAVEKIMDSGGAQWVVFAEFKETVACLARRLDAKGLTAAIYTGDVASQDRTIIEDEFQAGDIDVVVGTIGAMKEGITLTAASDMIFVDQPWVPAVRDQCEDRCHRIGQKDPVNIVVFEAEDTVDTAKIAPTLNVKRMIVGQIIDQDEVKETRS